jgi:hypothetical protein
MYRLVAIGLQILDRTLPRPQCVDFLAQRRDFLDLVVELAVLGGDEVVALDLAADVALQHGPDHAHEKPAGNDADASEEPKQLLLPFATSLAVRQQVDADCH